MLAGRSLGLIAGIMMVMNAPTGALKRPVIRFRTALCCCVAILLGAASTRAEWDEHCTPELMFAVARSYACQRYMNYHAVRTATPSAMVKKIQVAPFTIAFTSRSADRICGSVNFEPRKVTTTEAGPRAAAAIRLQAAINDAFNQTDAAVERSAIALADAVMDQEAAKTAVPTLRLLESVMTKFEGAMRDAITSHSAEMAIQTAAQRCTIKIADIIVSPPIVSPPDTSALRHYKDAYADYQKFIDWIANHAKLGETIAPR